MIKTLLFDLGGVVVPFDFTRAYAGLAPHCALEAGEIPRRIRATDLVPRFERGLLEPEEFFREISKLLELRMELETFTEIWASIFLPHDLTPDALLEALAAHYRLIALSNTNALHFPLVRERRPILRHFHAFVLSYQVRAMKPEPRIYQEAIARAGCRAPECFFTDDIPAYVEAARGQGMDAAQFMDAAKLEADLRARGVTW